jgi:hypothetical protein
MREIEGLSGRRGRRLDDGSVRNASAGAPQGAGELPCELFRSAGAAGAASVAVLPPRPAAAFAAERTEAAGSCSAGRVS